MSAFVLEDGEVYHTYSTYGRGLDVLLRRLPVAGQGAARAERARRPLVETALRISLDEVKHAAEKKQEADDGDPRVDEDHSFRRDHFPGVVIEARRSLQARR